MGRIGKLALGNVRSWMNQREVFVDEQLEAELVMLGERVRHERPRVVPPLTKQQPILVFPAVLGARGKTCIFDFAC